MKLLTERRLLQSTIALASLVPITAGAWGVYNGLGISLDSNDTQLPDLDNHFRYLSGLLLGIGLYFLWSLPRIEALTRPFRLLTCIIFIGGLSRLAGIMLADALDLGSTLPLIMELGVTPALCLWQNRFTRRHI